MPPPAPSLTLRCAAGRTSASVLENAARRRWMARPTLRPHTSALHPHSALCTPAGDIPAIKAILVVDADGKRILSRYYSADWPTSADETSFEKKLYDKTMRTNAKNEGGLASALATPATTSSAHISAALAPGLLMCLLHARRAAEVIMFDNVVTVYRNSADVWFYVVGSQCDSVFRRVTTKSSRAFPGCLMLELLAAR